MSNPRYERVNGYSDDEWPDNWGDEDIEFLAEFLRNETDTRLFVDVDADEWPYTIMKKVEQ